MVNANELGDWATIVSAEQLGLDPGEELTVYIKGVAAIANLRSNQINDVVTLYLARAGDKIIELESPEEPEQPVSKNRTVLAWLILILFLLVILLLCNRCKKDLEESESPPLLK